MNQYIEDFRANIRTRSEYDTVISGPLMVFVLFLPIIAILVLIGLCHSPDFIWSLFPARLQALSGYTWPMTLFAFSIEGFLTLLAINVMFDRLRTHSVRDDGWRSTLISYVHDMGLPTQELESTDTEIKDTEKFKRTWLVRALILLSIIFVIIDICILIPVMVAWAYLDLELLITITFMSTFTLAIIGMVSVFLKMYTISYRHEVLQARFTEELSFALAQKGLVIMPMKQFCSKPRPVVGLIVSVITLGLGAIVLILVSNKTMNNHQYNQWCYETYLLDKLSGTDEGYDYESMGITMDKSTKKALRKSNKAPKTVLLTELLVIALILNYTLRLIGITIDNAYNLTVNGAHFDHNGVHPIDAVLPTPTVYDTLELTIFKDPASVVMALISLILILMAFYTVTGLRSARPQSWRKVTRTCITFAATAVLSAVLLTTGYSHMFDFNVYLTVSILYVLFLMLILSRTIKEYYTPYGVNVPPTSYWVRYAITGEMKKE